MACRFFSSCASTKESGPLEDSVSVILPSLENLRAEFGRNYTTNPYLAPGGSFIATANDYIVLRITVVTQAGVAFKFLDAEAKDDKGKLFASYYNFRQFFDYVKGITLDVTGLGGLNNIRIGTLEQSYLPADSMHIDHGKHSYIIVLLGKHPLPDDLTTTVLLSIDDKIQAFDISVPQASLN